jgi:DNA excision repair protein ERCC-2
VTIRWDSERGLLTLAVKDLSDEASRGFSSFSGLSSRRRAELGREEHSRLQQASQREDSAYQAEVALSLEFTHPDPNKPEKLLKIEVLGRIDGMTRDADGRAVIEEIKTVIATPEDLKSFKQESFPHYARQLQLYRWVLKEQDGDCQARLRLVLVALPSRERRDLELSYDHEATWSFVRRRLDELIREATENDARRASRKKRAAELRFPFEGARSQQDELMAGIAAGLSEKGAVLASAPTGLGKSVAALMPALRFAMSEGKQVFVATSKTTQQQIFKETARAIASRSGTESLNSVVLTAREKVCQNNVILCHPEVCPYARDYESKLEQGQALQAMNGLPVADAEDFIRQGRAIEACPYFMAMDAATRADLIIGDYNYVFDPGATVRGLFAEGQAGEVVLVIDEAHNLVDRGAEYYSPVLPRELLAKALAETEAQAHDRLMNRAGRVLTELDEILEALEEGREDEAPKAPEPSPEAPKKTGQNLLLFDDPALAQSENKRVAKSRAKSTPRPRPKPAPSPTERSWVPRERCVRVQASRFTDLRYRLDEIMIGVLAEQARGRRPITPDDPVHNSWRAVGRFVTVLEQLDENFSLIYSRGYAPGTGQLKILCKDASRSLGARFRECAGAIAISATLEPTAVYRRLLGLPESCATLRMDSPFPAENRLVFVDSSLSTRYEQRENELPHIAQRVGEIAAARPGNVLVACPSYEVIQSLAPILRDGPWQLIAQSPGSSDEERAAILQSMDDYVSGLSRDPVLLLAATGGVFTEGVDYPGERCIGVIVVGPALPRVSFERRLIQAHFEKAEGDGFAFAYLYPGMNRVIQAAGRVHRRAEDRGYIALLGSRFLEAQYARLLPRAWYRKSPQELRCDDPLPLLDSFWKKPKGPSTNPRQK